MLNYKRIYILILNIAVNLMSVLAGVGYAWSSPCIPKLTGKVDPDSNPLPQSASVEQISWITSLHCLGAICGPLLTGIVAAKFGKKKTLLLFSIPQMISNILLIFANSVTLFYIARFLMGIGTGCVFSIVPMYVAEITETTHRGRTSMLMPLMITVTQDFVFVIGSYVTIATLAMISLVPSILFLIIFGIFIPESPYYFIKKNDLKEAHTTLVKLRENDDVNDELEDIVKSVNDSESQFSFGAFLKAKTVQKSFFISFCLMFFQQFNGINAIFAYQQSILDESNSPLPADKAVMIVALVSLVAIFLVSKLVDSFGRRILLISSYTGQLLSLLSLGLYFHLQNKNVNIDFLFWLPVTNIIGYMMSFKLGAGPISWTIAGEIFPSNYKFILNPLIAFIMNIMSFLVTFVFPRFWAKFSLEVSFWVFSVVVACALPFVIFMVPETKGKSFIEIQRKLEGITGPNFIK